MTSLDQLRPGQSARIASVGGSDELVQRLLELGLMEGETVEVVALAPLGDPIEVRCRDSRLSLRRAEAAGILVSPPEAP
jgi:ferrous iron transport protein A